MAPKIDAREVLAHLNELGYTNITAQQLKDFIKDLKKVIKYDQRHGGLSEESRGYSGEESGNCEESVEADKENRPERLAPPRHISVHIFDKKSLRHDHCVHTEQPQQEPTESTIKTIPAASTGGAPSSRGSSRPKVTFIRPGLRKPLINKSDPVALYHYYQAEWKKTKIPGQDKRADLRWAIRERMLSGPRVEVKSKCSRLDQMTT